MASDIQIRTADKQDVTKIISIFETSISVLTAKDYTASQREVWKNNGMNSQFWYSKMESEHFFLATIDNESVGFTSIDEKGYIDFLFIAPAFKRNGVATALFNHLLASLDKTLIHTLITKSSLTAKPFFEKMGFTEVEENMVEIEGETLTNYTMIKPLSGLG